MKWIPIFTLCQTTQRTIYEKMQCLMGEEMLNAQWMPHTVRLILPVSITGKRIRLSFTNADSETGKIDKIVVAKCTETGQIKEETHQEVTFRGEHCLKLKANGRKTSDILGMDIKAGEYLAISVYSEKLNMSRNTIEAMMIQSRPGDFCNASFENVDPTPEFLRQNNVYISPQFPMLSMIEMETESEPAVIGCLGDSITQQGYWFLPLLKKICRNRPEKAVLLNCGIGGNRLCKDSPESFGTQFGKAGVRRLDEDLLQIPHIDRLIFALGINDLLSGESENDPQPSPSAEEFSRACQEVAEHAGEANVYTVAYTLYPASLDMDAEEEMVRKRETLFCAYNEAIRRAGFHKVIELDPILKAAEGRQRYKNGMGQPDEVHLSAEGGRMLAESILSEELKI